MATLPAKEESEPLEGKKDGRAPLRCNTHLRHHVTPPPHHVVAAAGHAGLLEQLPLVSSLYTTSPEQLYPSAKTSVFLKAQPDTPEDASNPEQKLEYVRSGFRNPWPSWHKPGLSEVWDGLSWNTPETHASTGRDDAEMGQDENEELLAANENEEEFQTSNSSNPQSDPDADLTVVEPSFGHGEQGVVQATWLGHASVLLELPSLHAGTGARPLRLLFDPIFSMR